MNILSLKGTDQTPQVTLNKEEGLFEISGRSLPENALEFYRPVLAWLNEYTAAPNPLTRFVFRFDYINTGSSKAILNLLSVLEKIDNARVVWHFPDEDEDMEETGEEFSELVKVPFEFKPY